MIAQNKKEKARRKKGVIESDEVDKAILECISDGPISFIDIMRLMENTEYSFQTTFGLRKRMNALSKNGAIIKVPDKLGHHPKWDGKDTQAKARVLTGKMLMAKLGFGPKAGMATRAKAKARTTA